MPRISRQEQQARFAELTAMVAEGYEPHVAARRLGQRHKWSRWTRNRYLRMLFARAAEAAEIPRRDLVSTLVAQRARIHRAAMQRQKTVFVKGENGKPTATKVDDPDYSVALQASESIGRILGVETQPVHRLVIEYATPMVARWIEVLRHLITDPALLEACARELHKAMREDMEHVPDVVALGPVIDAAAQQPPTALDGGDAPPHLNGGTPAP